jgi:hypothetical protein
MAWKLWPRLTIVYWCKQMCLYIMPFAMITVVRLPVVTGINQMNWGWPFFLSYDGDIGLQVFWYRVVKSCQWNYFYWLKDEIQNLCIYVLYCEHYLPPIWWTIRVPKQPCKNRQFFWCCIFRYLPLFYCKFVLKLLICRVIWWKGFGAVVC